MIAIAREHGIWVVHDLAYADIVFDGYRAPSILQVPGAQGHRGRVLHAVEELQHAGLAGRASWSATAILVTALARIKCYHDYGTFTPIQVAAIVALEGPQDCVDEIREMYQAAPRRAVRRAERRRLERREAARRRCSSGRRSRSPTARWARSSSRRSCCWKRKVAVVAGHRLRHYGDGHVRFALIENEAPHPAGDPRDPRTCSRRIGLRQENDAKRRGCIRRQESHGHPRREPDQRRLLGIGTVGGGTFASCAATRRRSARRAGRARSTINCVGDKDLDKPRGLVARAASYVTAATRRRSSTIPTSTSSSS